MHRIRRIATLIPAWALAACTAAAARPGHGGAHPAPPPVAEPASGSAAATPLAASFAAAADTIFGDTAFRGANWGVIVRSAETGRTLYEHNSARLFVPASNMKIVTGSTALEVLGPDFRYRTALVAAGAVNGGVLHGDLVVVGSGDPSISTEFMLDPRSVFRAWADSLRAHGVTRVAGRIVGNDDVFDDVNLGRGWAWDDLADGYAAEISGLEYNLGISAVTVFPGSTAGAPATVTLDPPNGYVRVRNAVRTGARGSSVALDYGREPSGSAIWLSGRVPAGAGGVENDIAIRNNTAYFVAVLRETLQSSGIRVDGEAVDQDTLAVASRLAGGDTLFWHASPPLRDILPHFLKPSQNQIGEILLKTLGRVRRGEGSANAGIAVVDSVIGTWGLAARQLSQADGSGLSRYNLVAPELLVAILERMRTSPNAEVFYNALPVAGVDGTLKNRMRNTPLQGNVHAKTGTVSNVRSLSGYLTTAAGEPIVFSMIVNHNTLGSREADRIAERALMRLYNLPRSR